MKSLSEKGKALLMLPLFIIAFLIFGVVGVAIFFVLFGIWEVSTRKDRRKKIIKKK